MSWGNYICETCGNIIEYKKQYGVDFPDNLDQKCENCGKSSFVRTFTSVPVTSVAEGSTGIGGIYHPSPFTPMNVAYKAGRSSMFEKNGTVICLRWRL